MRRLIDPYVLALLATIGFAAFAPVRGEAAVLFNYVATAAIALLFFLYGAKLSAASLLAGLTHWRLQGLVFWSTYILFPLLGLLISFLAENVLPMDLVMGLLFLSLLPSTVQSSIAFTSIARGNVAAAMTSASISNLLGVFLTPLLVALLLSPSQISIDFSLIGTIAMQILVPFIFGQIARPWIGSRLAHRKTLTGVVDRSAILLVVYGAFSESMVLGIWSHIEISHVLWMAFFCGLLLCLVMSIIAVATRLFRFPRDDRIAILFCGSKKSLATGIPIAGILIDSQSVALLVLPLLFFHQLQLFVCALLAQHFAYQSPDCDSVTPRSGG